MMPFSWFHKIKHIFFLVSLILPLNQNWDRETNPSQKNTSEMYLLCCHLDVNRLVLHGFSKVSLLETYNSIHLYDLMYQKHVDILDVHHLTSHFIVKSQ